jgi:hypothetical protein
MINQLSFKILRFLFVPFRTIIFLTSNIGWPIFAANKTIIFANEKTT